ncbi:MAG: hypothetical protein QOH50_5051 [Kribbellaceae bacterium]|nr:hypothetical protein [Kribbellaceae bacterium]
MSISQSQSSTKKSQRCYLQAIETDILRECLVEWNRQPDKKSRDLFVVTTVLPKIQLLNPDKYGPNKISQCKESKKLWDKRVKVCETPLSTSHFIDSESWFRQFLGGLKIISHTRTRKSSSWRRRFLFVKWLEGQKPKKWKPW